MRYLKYVALLVLLALPAAYSQAQIAIGVQIGPSYGIYNAPPVCEYGFYPAYPFGCAPYGYYGPEWFADGIFIGAGPWYNFYYTHAGFYRPFYVNRGFGFHREFVRFHEDRFRGDGFRSFRGDDRRFRDRDDFRGRGFRDRDDFRGRGFRDRDDFRGRGRDDDHGRFRGGEGFRNSGYRSFNNGGDRAFRDGGRFNGGGRSYGRGESHGGGRSYGSGGSHGGGRSYGGGSHNSGGGSHGGGGSRGGGHR